MEEIFVVPAFPELKLGFGDSPKRGGRGLISAQNFLADLLTNWMLIAIITPLGAFLFGMGRSTDEEFARFAQGNAGGDLGVGARAPKWLTAAETL
jgi:hypothetical protein